MGGESDTGHLEFAAREGRALLTHNIRDFRVLHKDWMEAGRAHSGIILVHQGDRLGPGELVRRIWALSGASTASGVANRAEFLE